MPETLRYKKTSIRLTQWGYQVDIMRHGKRYRKTFSGHTPTSLARAKDFIDNANVEAAAEHRALTPLELQDARKALDLLPDGTSLLDAVRSHLKRTKGIRETPTITLAAERYIDDKIALGKRPATIHSARVQVARLASLYPDTPVGDFTRHDLADWLKSLTFKSPITRNNLIRDISGFFNWCIEEGYALENPAASLKKSEVDDTLPRVYTVAAVADFLAYLEEKAPGLIPYHVAGFFAGLRSTEMHRMEATNFTATTINVSPKDSKTRSRRVIEMQPNLIAWLQRYPIQGALEVQWHRKRCRDARLAVPAVHPWITNVMRHSFATYHLAKFRNAPLTAHDLGHPDANLVYSTYRTLATVADGEAFFSIMPKH